jgi:hypothetical protein
VKLVHLVGFITKKFDTIHGHMNVKKKEFLVVKHEERNVSTIIKDIFYLIFLEDKG